MQHRTSSSVHGLDALSSTSERGSGGRVKGDS
jgi:hypothetical protein